MKTRQVKYTSLMQVSINFSIKFIEHICLFSKSMVDSNIFKYYDINANLPKDYISSNVDNWKE